MTIDQIVFRWAERTLTGGRGVGPVATSLAADALTTWDRRLDRYVWAADGPDAVAYLRFADEAAIIRKRPFRDPHGRAGSTLAHVLVGPADRLTGVVALGLAAAAAPPDGPDPAPAIEPGPGTDGVPDTGTGAGPVTGPERALDAAADAGPELAAMPYGDVEDAAEHGLAKLRTAARALPAERTAGLLAAVLADPAADLTVLDAAPDALALTCAVADIIGDATFATGEDDDTRPGLHLVFLTGAPPASSHEVRRRRLRLDGAGAEPGIGAFARALADRYRDDGTEGLAGIRPRGWPETTADVAAWMATVQPAPGVLTGGDGAALLERAVAGRLTGAERDYLADPARSRDVARYCADLSTDALIRLLADGAVRPEPVPGLARMLAATAIDRYLTASGGGPDALRSAIQRARVDPELIRARLDVWRSGRPHPSLLVRAVIDASDLGLPSNPRDPAVTSAIKATITATLEPLTADELLAWADQHAGEYPDIGALFVGVATARHPRGRELASCRELLAGGCLSGMVAVIEPDPDEAGARSGMFRALINLAYPGGLREDEAQSLLGDDPPAELLYAAANLGDQRTRGVVERAAAHRLFRQAGLMISRFTPSGRAAHPATSASQVTPWPDPPAPPPASRHPAPLSYGETYPDPYDDSRADAAGSSAGRYADPATGRGVPGTPSRTPGPPPRGPAELPYEGTEPPRGRADPRGEHLERPYEGPERPRGSADPEDRRGSRLWKLFGGLLAVLVTAVVVIIALLAIGKI